MIWLLAPHRAESERHRGVAHHRPRGDEADELLPSREGQEYDAADQEVEENAHDRHAPLAEDAEDRRDVAVAGHGEKHARAGGRVEEASPAGGDRGVYVDERRKPAGTHGDREASEGTRGPRERELRPPVPEFCAQYPPDREPYGAPEGEVGVSGRTPRHRVHAPEFGVDER